MRLSLGPSQPSFEATLTESVALATYVFAQNKKSVSVDELRAVPHEFAREEISGALDYWEDFDQGSKLLATEGFQKTHSEAKNFGYGQYYTGD